LKKAYIKRKTHYIVDDLAGHVGHLVLAHHQLVRLDVFFEALLGVRRQLEHHGMAAPGTGHQKAHDKSRPRHSSEFKPNKIYG